MTIVERTYERIALEDPEGRWELHRGRPREKPAMSWSHTDVIAELGFALRGQVDPAQFRVHIGGSRLRRSNESYYIPDIAVIPTSLGAPLRGRHDRAEILIDPLPLVVEVWSPATGAYDIDQKIPEYQARGDLEIWRLHPYDRTLTVWRRRPDGTYAEQRYDGGVVEVGSLPGVRIDLGSLFED